MFAGIGRSVAAAPFPTAPPWSRPLPHNKKSIPRLRK
ncbi:hypothetical protein RSAG8_10054, partial [Rhizoctonia solani AG-8 WAC10335]